MTIIYSEMPTLLMNECFSPYRKLHFNWVKQKRRWRMPAIFWRWPQAWHRFSSFYCFTLAELMICEVASGKLTTKNIFSSWEKLNVTGKVTFFTAFLCDANATIFIIFGFIMCICLMTLNYSNGWNSTRFRIFDL